jgi:hypothetical protein
MEVPHNLEKEVAATRLRDALEQRRGELEQQVSDLETNWSGEELAYSFSTFGLKVGGTLLVQQDSVKVDASIPLPAMMFKGKIKQAIEEEFGKLLT